MGAAVTIANAANTHYADVGSDLALSVKVAGGTAYSNAANWVGGSAVIGNTTQTAVIASAGTGLKNYVTDLEISNSGNVTVTVSFNDSSSSVFIAPAGAANNPPIVTPLATAGNTAFAATLSGSTSAGSVYISARGFKAA
jgi:hypothetical protein